MSAESLQTLYHPFASEALPMPGAAERGLFLGAEPGFRLPPGFAAEMTLVQGFRPANLSLAKAGHHVVPQPEGEGYDLVLVLGGRHRGQNETRVAEALRRARPGGRIVVAGGKEDGIAPLRRKIEDLLLIDGHLAKHHGVAFWLTRPDTVEDAVTALMDANPPSLVENRFETRAGMFSHGKVDAGSRFLAENLPKSFAGTVADFCAGWGSLATTVADRATNLAALDLYEADFEALEAARRNVAIPPERAQPRFFWLDLQTEPAVQRYDRVIMNPPFHHGRAAAPDIGRDLIRAAAKAVKPGGELWMVANRQLPYEETLAREFLRFSEVARDNMFKVLVARR